MLPCSCLPGKTEIFFKLQAPSVLRGHDCYHGSSAWWQRPECHPACQVKQIFSSNYELVGFYVGAAVITVCLSPAGILLPCLPGKSDILFKIRAWSVLRTGGFYDGSSIPGQRLECRRYCKAKERFSSKYELTWPWSGYSLCYCTPRQDSKMLTCWPDLGRSKWLSWKEIIIFHLISWKVSNFCSLKSWHLIGFRIRIQQTAWIWIPRIHNTAFYC